MTWKKNQANWKMVTAALVINEEHMTDCHTTLKLLCPKKSLGEEPNQRYQKKELAKRLKPRFTERI